MPTISISSPTLTKPRSIRPVTTVPRPEIENTSSIGIKKRKINRSIRLRDIAINRLHQCHDRRLSRLVLFAFKRRQRRALDDRDIIPWKLVARQKLPYLQLNKLKKLLVINLINLVSDKQQSPVHQLGAPARCAPGSAASDHRPPTPQGLPHPSGLHL